MTERNIYLEDITLDDALKRLETMLRESGRWSALEGERVALQDALGRVTSEAVYALISSPHYHCAAMDGYAVHSSETHGATETRPVRLITGQHVYPVNTGDPLPEDTNAVIMIENVQQVDDAMIEILAPVAPWQHVRLMGEDIVQTEIVLSVNHRLRPVDLGAIAGCGHSSVMVRRKPRVTLIPTGSELVSPDQSPKPGQIIEYNSLILRGQVLEAGAEGIVTSIVPDDLDRLREVLKQAVANEPDLILVLSGSSAGSRDFAAAVIRDLGELLVHGVAVRPGHPVIIGRIKDIPVMGIPGYPVSAALTGEIFVKPLLFRWLGIEHQALETPKVQAIATHKLASPTGDDDFVRVTLAQVEDRLLAAPLHRGAGVITSLVRADGLAHIPRFSEGVDMGQPVEVSLYRPLALIWHTVMMLGSHDPMLDLLGQYLTTRFPGYRLTSANVGSMGGLIALKRKAAHIAGVHLLDPETNQYNIPYVQRYLPDEAVQLVTFAHREQGLIVAAGNPSNIRSIDDLPRVRFVNRQRGAGTRILLDYELEQRGIDPEMITGYTHEVYTHMAVAAAVASGIADCGLGVQSAAAAMNLDIIPIGQERYDIVIPDRHIKLDAVQHLLSLLQDEEFRSELQSTPGYDTRQTGVLQYRT